MADQDTEITLGTGKLLGLFFGLVAICGVFFVMGYSVGRNTSPAATTLTAEPTVPAATPVANVSKPAATQGVIPKVDCAANPEQCPPTDDGANNAASPVQPATAPAVNANAATPAVVAPQQPATAPEVAKSSVPTGYMVQIAAVSKQQDAEALVAALRKKQYPVFVANGTSDTLFHVQIGPFADAKEAEAVRSRLVTDGYNPILKK